jgi:hypothetical protein
LQRIPRLARQLGRDLGESQHIGAEFVDAAKKSYDAMGGPNAYSNFRNGSEFFRSIVRHVNKSVDYVAIDLQGASQQEIEAIQKFVSNNLSAAQQAKIVYVLP